MNVFVCIRVYFGSILNALVKALREFAVNVFGYVVFQPLLLKLLHMRPISVCNFAKNDFTIYEWDNLLYSFMQNM